MSRRIALRGLTFYGHHGAYAHERRLGQPFVVDLELAYDFRPAAQTDDVRDALDYRVAYRIARDIFEGGSLRLLETLVERAAGALLDAFPQAESVRVVVRKPHAPLGGPAECVEAEASLTRGG